MAWFEYPEGWVPQAYRFVLDPTPTQCREMLSHAGGARFAFNVMLAVVKANLDQRAAERSYGLSETDLTPPVDWSFQSLRNGWNCRKHIVAVAADGAPWWSANSKEVYACACRSLADALSNWEASRNGGRHGRPVGFPRFKTKARAVKRFSFTTGVMRVEPDRHHITLPRLGAIKTYESTRKLARRLESGTARILRATVGFERGRWLVSLTCLVLREIARPAHVKPGAAVVGLDAGVKDLIVVADAVGNELARHQAPRELKTARRKLRALQRKAARQRGPWDPATMTRRNSSRGWQRTQREIRRTHARVAHLRTDRIHKITTGLSQAHTVIGVETLAVKNMMVAGGARKRGLNRALGDAGLGELLRRIDYKTAWYGSRTVKADRLFPSSKLCSGCGAVKAKLHLAERRYRCGDCGLAIDRDLNAAINLARYAQRETGPSTGVVTGGANRKPPPPGGAGGAETRTRAAVGQGQ